MIINWLCSIPEEIGWVLVGAAGMLALEMFGLLVGTVVDIVRERMMDDEEEAF